VVFLKLSRCIAPAAGVALTVTLGLAPAQASTPGWRVVQTFKATSETDSIAADSAGDAWTAGEICQGQCKVNHPLVSHWDGSAWQPVTAPLTRVASFSEAIVGASSASNAWDFAQVGLGPRTEALHWNGAAWDSATKFPATSAIQATAVLGPADAWAFGEIPTHSPAYVVRYNGTGWSQVKFPPVNVTFASALSSDDIWTAGSAFASSAPTVVHWTGHAWHTVPLPHITLPPGGNWVPSGLAAIAPDDVWLLGIPGSSQNIIPGTILLHWNGRAWARVKVPYPTLQPALLAQDGSGGVWLTSFNIKLHENFLYHDAGGTWSRVPVPGNATHLSALSWIPGGGSLWASGFAGSAKGTRGVILKYGP
jgi:hypothetical protein